ncbi:hypothetical protein [Rhodoblastus sp.]|uniref:hypothetical protein n=1 Tax=Rhodoblastus sp. TaxID=1962975 RepID=UPI002623E918|nr:hypothetical protein [Rhodoblastus sp.]
MIKPRSLPASAGVAALLWLAPASGVAFAQSSPFEDGGFRQRRAEPVVVDDKAFDCATFRKLIAAAPDGFKAMRGPATKDADAVAAYGVTEPLFGACEIIDKKKIGDVIYSCAAKKIKIADIKATADACLGDKAFGFAGNENPSTQFLRYEPRLGDARARVIALTTFGKTTLAIMKMR